MKRIKSGDTVIVIAGKSKGHVGKVIGVQNKIVNGVMKNSVKVEGANIIKKHVKPNPKLEQKGGIVSYEGPLDISNVAILNPATNKADKVFFKFVEKNNTKLKVRCYKSNNELIDIA